MFPVVLPLLRVSGNGHHQPSQPVVGLIPAQPQCGVHAGCCLIMGGVHCGEADRSRLVCHLCNDLHSVHSELLRREVARSSILAHAEITMISDYIQTVERVHGLMDSWLTHILCAELLAVS